jgi:hypothetical protein
MNDAMARLGNFIFVDCSAAYSCQGLAVSNRDSSRSDFEYDSLCQLTNGVRHWSDGADMAGHDFGYQFDGLGNRLTAPR